MSYPYEDITWSDTFDMPLGAYDTFEDLENYLGTQPYQTDNPYSSTKRPHQPQPVASTSSIPTWDSNAYSSSIYPVSRTSSLPSLSWTSDASPSDFHPIPHLSPFTTPLTEDDYAFFTNMDLLPPDSNLFNVATNPQLPHCSPEPVAGHAPPSSKKRPYTNEESECPDNASFIHKRRKLSIDSHQNPPDIRCPMNLHNDNRSNNNIISDTFNNFNLSVENLNDNTFLANLDPSLLNSNLFNVTTNPSIPHAPEPVGHHSPSSRKRMYTNEERDSINVSNGASANPIKRRKLSTDGYKDLSTIPPPPSFFENNISKAIPDVVNNCYVPAPTLSTNAVLSQPYPNPNMFDHVPHPSANIPPTPPATIPPAYVPVTQPGSGVPSRAINYSADLNVYPNANLNTAAGGRNAFPWDPLSYLTPPEAGNGISSRTTGLFSPKNSYNATARGVTPGPSVITLVPPFLGQQAPSGAPYNNIIRTDAYANNAAHSGVDICQHSTSTNRMSMTGHTANASMPSTCMPSTRAASSAEPVLTFKFYQPTPSPPSPPSPTPASRPTQARPKRRGPQLVPARHLWEQHENGTFVCLYKGPAKPNGCSACPTSLRNLGRHMRTHACAESKMSIPRDEKIAFNGMPPDLRIKVATCSLDDAELHHCAYFREHGKRWEEETLERPDGMLRQHENRSHPLEYRKMQKSNSRKKRSAKS